MPRLRQGSAIVVVGERSPSTFVNREIWRFALVCVVCLVFLVGRDQPDEPDRRDRPDKPQVLSLGLADGLSLFPFEFGPAVIEPLSSCASCV